MRDNSIEILYYESMIDSVIEDRKIMESVFEYESNSLTLQENSTELAVCEANILEKIGEAISNLFERVISFVKGLIEKITGKLLFKPNSKIITACEEKIKSMSSEERDKVNLVNLDMTDDIKKRIDWAQKQQILIDNKLREAIHYTNQFMEKKYTRDPKTNLSDVELDRVKDSIVKLNAAIDKLNNLEDMRNSAKTIKFNDIKTVLNEYKDESLIKDLNVEYNKIVKEMKNNQRIMNGNMRANRENIIRPYDQKELGKYRDLIHFITGALINLARFNYNMNILLFRNKEAILRRFLGTTDFANVDKKVDPNFKMLAAAESAEEINEYFEYEDEAVNELALFLPDDLKKLKNDIKVSCKDFNKRESDKLKESKKDKKLVGKLKANFNYNTSNDPKTYAEVEQIMKKHKVELLGHRVFTTYYNNVPTTNEHVLMAIYKDYVLTLKVLQAYGAPSISMGSISIKYDPKKCSIPKNVVLDVISSMGVIDSVSSGKNSIKVSPKNLYYIKTELPKLEKKYSDEYDVKKNFGGFSITLSKKK